MIEPIDFIRALWRSDRYIETIYLNGGCYQFYILLKTIYPTAEPYTSFDRNHIATKINNVLYDVTGDVDDSEWFEPLTKEQEEICKKWSFSKNNSLILAECPVCEEPITI